MSDSPCIQAEVTFLTEQEGGRQSPAFDSSKYRPSLVVGDPRQRTPIFESDGRTIKEEYLPVVFNGDGREMAPSQSFFVELKLYWPGCRYSQLATGTEFTIREGPRIVGFGRVKKGMEHGVT